MGNQNLNVQDGLTHMLDKVRNYGKGQIDQFEGRIADGLADADDILNVCDGCLFDVKLINGTLIEFKSYSLTTIQKISTSQGAAFQKQFKQYLQSATDNNSFKYVFNLNKISDVSLIKIEFQKFIGANADEIFRLNPGLFNNAKIKIPNGKALKAMADQNKLIDNVFFDFINLE